MKVLLLSDDGPLVRLQITGPITQRDVSPFVEPLADVIGPDAYKRQVAIDMQEVELLDSSGVGWLLACQKRFREHGGQLVLHSFPPLVANVFRVLNMQQVLQLAASEQEALEKLDGDAS